MPPQVQPQSHLLALPADTELVALEFALVSPADVALYPQYAIALHAWFLNQVRLHDPELSAYLHDGESEKPFAISGLIGAITTSGKELKLSAQTTYRWYVSALSARVAAWMAEWVQQLPSAIQIREAVLQIRACQIAQPPTTYSQLLNTTDSDRITLHFLSPTSFRRKGHHFPLPVPSNVFHSYLRRWNDFSGIPYDQDEFLAWVEESVLINRHHLESAKVLAGKKGAVTGFTGAIQFGLTKQAAQQPQFQQLFAALGQLAPYCGTGHKTTFGLGQTRLGWTSQVSPAVPDVQTVLAQRIEDLTEIFKAQRQRTGGERAEEIAVKWATILARRELGESLVAIASDLEMPYETVKTYAKLSRRALKSSA